MATSYSNTGGKGDRRSFITITQTCMSGSDMTVLVNGDYTTTGAFFNGAAVSGLYIEFDFLSRAIIDEVTFYQSTSAALGTWKWQGSNDNSTWTDVGSSFALGGVTTQVITSLAGNTTGYRYYRMLGVSGTSSTAGWTWEFEFKISDDPTETYSYLRAGVGNRSAIITASSSGITFGVGTAAKLVDGIATGSDCWWSAVAAGAYLRFDLGGSIIVNELRWMQSATTAQGTWQLQGSPDASTWTNIGSVFTLGGVLTEVIAGGTSAYRYYQLAWQSGSVSSGPNLWEIQFKTDVVIGAAPSITGVEASKANVYAVTSPRVGVDVSKANVYAAVSPPTNFTVNGQASVSWTATGGAAPPSFTINGAASLDFEATTAGGPLNFRVDGQSSLIFWAQKAGTGVCGVPLPAGPGGYPGGSAPLDTRNYVF